GIPRFTFDFLGGDANYRITDGSGTFGTTLGFTDTGLTTSFILTGSNNYSFSVTAGTGATYLTSGTLGGTAGSATDRFIGFNNNAGFNSTNDTYFNRLQISPVPEPSSLLMICLGGSAVSLGRRIARKRGANS